MSHRAERNYGYVAMKSESVVPIRRADIPANLTPAAPAFLSSIAGLGRKQLAIEVGLRVCCVAMLSVFLASALVQFARDPSRITLLLMAVADF